MTLKKVIRTATIISGIIIVLMLIFRHAKSELFTLLSLSLGGTIFFTVLYYLFTTERIKSNTSFTKNKYIFYAISIPLLFFAIDVTAETDGFLKNAVRALLALEVFYLIFSWVFMNWKNIQTLKNDKAKAELALLKDQINPHFFFNSLNCLYSLIKKDPDHAQEYVLKLSDMIRFTVYEGNKQNVTLADELIYLKNYIDLNVTRYHKTIDVQFTDTIQDSQRKIAPLLFIILLENAFKHGVEKLTDDAFVHLNMVEEADSITFEIKNNFDTDMEHSNPGIGLENLKNRLELLYPNKHKLVISKEKSIYYTSLQIILE
jgi:two-component system sensor histidine kinase AlgZ